MTASFLSLAQALQAGKHTYLWDASDKRGKHVSNGIYFVNLRADSEHRCIKIAYIARGIIVGSPRDIEPKDAIEITEEDMIKAEITPEQYEQAAKKLARSMAVALPKIQSALWQAMELSSDEVEHKVKLAAFISPAISSDICQTGYINELDLQNIIDTYSDMLYIEAIYGDIREWEKIEREAKNKIKIIAVLPPYDEKEWEVVYAYNIEGEEVKLSPDTPPDFPIFLITYEPPFFGEFSEEGKVLKKLGEGSEAHPLVTILTDTTYVLKIAIYRKVEWDAMEIYIKYWTDYYGGAPAMKKRTSLYKVNALCTWYSWDLPGKNVSGVVEILAEQERHNRIEVWEKDHWWREGFNPDDFVGKHTFTGNDRIHPGGWYNILDGSAEGDYCDTNWVGDDILDAIIKLRTGIEYGSAK